MIMFVMGRFIGLRKGMRRLCKLVIYIFLLFFRCFLFFNGMKNGWLMGLCVCVCVYRKVFASFGGLLLYIEGPYKKLTPLRVDYIYLLVKK